MPRAKPSEQLFPVAYRLTRTQIRKVQEMGGVAWLRNLISATQKSRHGRDPVQYIRDIARRNAHIVSSPSSSRSMADYYNLSIKRVQQIRREHRNA